MVQNNRQYYNFHHKFHLMNNLYYHYFHDYNSYHFPNLQLFEGRLFIVLHKLLIMYLIVIGLLLINKQMANLYKETILAKNDPRTLLILSVLPFWWFLIFTIFFCMVQDAALTNFLEYLFI